jgi:hypothetical protein
MTGSALAFGDGDDEQVKAGAATLLISAAEMLCALAAAGVPHDRLGGYTP